MSYETDKPAGMRLVIFDVDGTLTDSMAVDAWCFLRTFVELCGITNLDADWSRYKNVTDAGVFQEVILSRLGRYPSLNEKIGFRDHMVKLLRAEAQNAPMRCVAGAAQFLAWLEGSGQFRVAIATGCWSESARVKMASAGMHYDDYPSASADDALERESIIRLAIQRAVLRIGAIDGAVYIGDGIWDARACRDLGLPFIGVGTGRAAEKLLDEGAISVVKNFLPVSDVMKAIDKATTALPARLTVSSMDSDIWNRK